jgi:hypothetical protein
MTAASEYNRQSQENIRNFLQGVKDERNANFKRLALSDLAIVTGLAAGPFYRKYIKGK